MPRDRALALLTERPTHPAEVGARMAKTVTVVSTGAATGPGEVHLMTVDSFTIVSDEPAIALVALRTSSRMVPLITAGGAFAASVLAEGQSALATWFASRHRPPGASQLTGVSWHPAELIAAPLLDGAVGWFECVRPRFVPVGDHVVVTAEVVVARSAAPGPEPLVRHQRTFRQLSVGHAVPGRDHETALVRQGHNLSSIA